MDAFQTKLGKGLDTGEFIYLRPLLPADLGERYESWFRDKVVTHFLEARDISAIDALKHLVDGFVQDSWYMYAIVLRDSALHIGNVKIGPINRRHQTADVSIVIGEKEYWGKGYATTAVVLATRIAFGQLGIRKLSAGMIEGNTGSVRAFENAGWKVEAVLPDQVLHEGSVKARILVTCLNEHHSTFSE